jgi:hypothetical protein
MGYSETVYMTPRTAFEVSNWVSLRNAYELPKGMPMDYLEEYP